MNLKTRLYYECHITIDPVTNERQQNLKEIIHHYNFRIADLYLKKDNGEQGDKHTLDCFVSGRSNDYVDIFLRMKACILSLRNNAFNVRRFKIEDTLLDSRKGDTLD